MVGCAVAAGASSFDIIFNLCQKYLGDDVDEKGILDVIAARLGEHSGDGADYGYADIVHLDEAAVCLTPDDLSDVKNEKAKVISKQKEHAEAVKDYISKKAALAKAKPKGKGRAKGAPALLRWPCQTALSSR